MYKTQTEKFLLSENISLSVIRESGSENGHYALLRIGLFGMNGYALCVLGEDYAIETVGTCYEEAERLFMLAVREGISAVHLFDVVSDHRREEQ